MSLTDVAGVRVGHWTDTVARTGCTVVLLPTPNSVAVDIRGASPGSRETALLGGATKGLDVHAILLSGGSAYGLAAADGVMAELESTGIGYETPFGLVPIVPAAVIYDLGVGDPSTRPGRDAGREAVRAATAEAVETGAVGAGCGATTGKWRGFEHARPSGVYTASRMVGEATVASLVVVNAVGDVDPDFDAPLPDFGDATPFSNTTLAVVATDAAVSRQELARLCVRAHDAYAASIYPVHTRYDGDLVFSASCGTIDANLDALGEAVFAVTRAAILDAGE